MVADTLLAAVAIIALLALQVATDRLHRRATGRPAGDCHGCAGCARLVLHDKGSDDATR